MRKCICLPRYGLVGLLSIVLVLSRAGPPVECRDNDISLPAFVNSGAGQAAALGSVGTSGGAPNPYVNASPTSDGTGLYISAGRIGVWASPVHGTISVSGPTAHIRSHTLTYDAGVESYLHLFEGVFTPEVGAEGSIQITSTQSLSGTVDTGPLFYRRAFVPLTDAVDLMSADGLFSVHLGDHSFPADAYTVILPTNAPPGPLPFNQTQIGSSYAFRASGSVVELENPGLLKMYYTSELLGDASPQDLSIYAWNAAAGRWENLGGSLNQSQGYVSVAVQQLTVYALMAPKGPIYDVYLPLVQRDGG